MRSFQGKLRLADRPAETMGAGIEVAAGSMSLIISDQAVAAWPLERVDIEVETDGFHFIVDGEEFIFVTRDASEFAEAVGLFEKDSQGSASGRTKTLSRSEPKVARQKPARRVAADPRRLSSRYAQRPKLTWPQMPKLDWSSRVTQLGVAALVLAALLAIFARALLAFALMGAGSLGLLLGTGAMIDPIVATRLPQDLTAGKSVLIAVVLLLSGMLFLVI